MSGSQYGGIFPIGCVVRTADDFVILAEDKRVIDVLRPIAPRFRHATPGAGPFIFDGEAYVVIPKGSMGSTQTWDGPSPWLHSNMIVLEGFPGRIFSVLSSNIEQVSPLEQLAMEARAGDFARDCAEGE